MNLKKDSRESSVGSLESTVFSSKSSVRSVESLAQIEWVVNDFRPFLERKTYIRLWVNSGNL